MKYRYNVQGNPVKRDGVAFSGDGIYKHVLLIAYGNP